MAFQTSAGSLVRGVACKNTKLHFRHVKGGEKACSHADGDPKGMKITL